METPDTPTPRSDRWILVVTGLAALAPFIVYHAMFRRLFWFGDEFDLIDQIDRLGFWHWIWFAFAENFVPLFKLLWGGSVLLFHGSYFVMLVLVWLTHALNVGLLGRLMRTAGLPWAAVLFAQAFFGLTPGNMETLGWSVQGSAMLSVTFMLLALDALLRRPYGLRPMVWAACSALAFSRGVLTGALLSLGSLASGADLRRRLSWALAYLVPSVLVAALIAVLVSGDYKHIRGHMGESATFGTWNYALNPTLYLLSVESWGWRTVGLLGLFKLSLVTWALCAAEGRLRLLIVMLVAFDLGNAVLLGIGRFNSWLPATVSSRYQYAALVGFMPLAGFAFSRALGALRTGAIQRTLLAGAVVAAASLAMLAHWPSELISFTHWRGTESRRIVLGDPRAATYSVPGIPFMTITRARELVERYHLH